MTEQTATCPPDGSRANPRLRIWIGRDWFSGIVLLEPPAHLRGYTTLRDVLAPAIVDQHGPNIRVAFHLDHRESDAVRLAEHLNRAARSLS